MRKLKRESNNPLEDMSDLEVYGKFHDTSPDTIEVFADIRINPLVEDVGGRDFTFGPTRASIKFYLMGSEPEMGERYSDHLSPADEETNTLTNRNEISSGLSASLKAGIDASTDLAVPNVGMGAHATGSVAQMSVLERVVTSRRSNKFIKSKAGLRWEIEPRNPDDPNCFLDDTYAQGHRMFRAKVKDGANAISVSSQLYCRKKDFAVVAKDRRRGDSLFGVKNREKIMALVIARSIKQSENSSGMLGEEWLILSTSTLTEAD
jgi:hypothetical protein